MFFNFAFSIIFYAEIEMYFGALSWFVMVLIYNYSMVEVLEWCFIAFKVSSKSFEVIVIQLGFLFNSFAYKS
jgi:hypothetical protein